MAGHDLPTMLALVQFETVTPFLVTAGLCR